MNFFFNLFQEIKRRKMFKPLAVYASFAFIAIQVTDVVIKRLFFPDWIGTFIVIVILIGFPVTFFLSWIYDITPDGIERTGNESASNLPNSANNTKKILLPITGILTIIGGAFWVFYSLGSLSHGADLDKKLFKSIAVLYLDNLSNNQNDENISTALTQGITTAISRLGLYDVRPRTDVLQFKNKITSFSEIGNVLGVDAYIDGSIIKAPNGKEYIADIALVDAQRGNNLWAGHYSKASEEVLNIPDLVVSDISKYLGGNEMTENISAANIALPVDNKNFSLMGSGINLLDSGEYEKSIHVFDSILSNDPDNKRAIYSKGQAQEGAAQYQDAIKNYKAILENEIKLSRLKNIWTYPENNTNIAGSSVLNHNILISNEHDVQVIITRNKEAKKTELFVIEMSTNKELWYKAYPNTSISGSIEGNHLVLRTSSLGDKEATLYIHNLKTSKLILAKEFSKSPEDGQVIITALDHRIANNSKYNNLIYINVRRDDNYQILVYNPENNSFLWDNIFPLNKKSKGTPIIYSFEVNNKHYVMHRKGINNYLFDGHTGNMVWKKVLSDEGGRAFIHNNNSLIYYSKNNSNISIENSISQKLIGNYTLDSPTSRVFEFNDNIIIKTNNSLTSLKTFKPFLRSIKNWDFRLEDGEIFKSTFLLGNNLFGFTTLGKLFCISAYNGQIVNVNNLDIYAEAEFVVDEAGLRVVISADDFLTGIDPHNGKTLWKIRELNIDDWDDLIAFVNNKLVVIKQTDTNEPGRIMIMAYNPITGDLLWRSDELLYTNCDDGCDYSLYNNNGNIYITTSHKANTNLPPADRLFAIDLSWVPDKHYIPKDNLLNQLATCYEKANEISEAKEVLKEIIESVDQQNEIAYMQLSNIYLRQKQQTDYVNILSDYYELVKYIDAKRVKLEGQFMQHANLQWVHNLHKESGISINMPKNNLVLVGGCEVSSTVSDWSPSDRFSKGCFLSAYRKQSGIKLWEQKYSMIKDYVFSMESDGFLLFIGSVLDERQQGKNLDVKNTYTMLVINPRTGDVEKKYSLFEETSEKFRFWDCYSFDNSYILDVSFGNERKIKSIDKNSGDEIWLNTYVEDKFMRMKPIDIVKSNNNIIIPLNESLESVGLLDGHSVWSYDYSDDIDGIEYLKQDGIINTTLSFISEDNEYIVFDFIKQKLLFQEDLDFEGSGGSIRFHFVDSQYILGYNSLGYIALYEKFDDIIKMVWENQYEDIGNIISFENILGLINEKHRLVTTIDLKTGNQINQYQLIWTPETVFVDKKFLGCVNNRKLYFLNL